MRTSHISDELLISRHINGIKLISPDDRTNSGGKLLSIYDVNSLPFAVYLYNTENTFLESNDNNSMTIGFESRKDAIGHSVARISDNQEQVRKIFINNDKVIRTGNLNIVDERVDIKNQKCVHCLSFKLPWYNDINKIIGIFGCSIWIHNNELSNITNELGVILNNFMISQIPVKELIPGKEIANKYFSARETEILRWIIRGKTIRDISVILGLSYKTVESYYENIKNKAGVCKKSHLIEKILPYFS